MSILSILNLADKSTSIIHVHFLPVTTGSWMLAAEQDFLLLKMYRHGEQDVAFGIL